MQWYEIIQLVLAILRILNMIPAEKRKIVEPKVFEAVAKVITENNIT